MNLIMPFLNESPDYCHGVECGQAWVRMEQGYVFDNYSIHAVNVEQFKLMCDVFDYEYKFQELDETWAAFWAKKRLKKLLRNKSEKRFGLKNTSLLLN